MANMNRGDRPLSPHLTIYRPQITSVMSIVHRLTGIGLALTAVLVVWWFLAAATGPERFAAADGFLTSWFGLFILLVSLAAFWYHFFNGIRHLWWDTGRGLELDQVQKTGIAVLAAAGLLFLLTLLLA